MNLTDDDLKLIKKDCSYFNILLYNCIDSKEINADKLSIAFDDIIAVYEKLFDFSIALAGYQFIGLSLQNNLYYISNVYLVIAYFILAFGFLLSIFGALLCFIPIEFLRTCRHENIQFIIHSINKYRHVFKLADKLIYFNCILFIVPINIIVYNTLNTYFGVVYSIVSCLLFVLGIASHYVIIVRRQILGKSKRNIY